MVMKKLIPLILTAVMAVWVLSALVSTAGNRFSHARIWPAAGVAGRPLPAVRFRRAQFAAANPDATNRVGKQPNLTATDWLIEVMMKPEQADDLKIFRIDNLRGSRPAQVAGEARKYYSFNQIQPHLDEIQSRRDRIDNIDDSKRTVFESPLDEALQRAGPFTSG